MYVRRRKALVSGQFDLDEVTGTMLIEMLSDHFDSDLIAASKQVYELEMVNVMGLLVSGRASAIVPQVCVPLITGQIDLCHSLSSLIILSGFKRGFPVSQWW